MNFHFNTLSDSTKSVLNQAILRHYPYMESREKSYTLSGLVDMGVRYADLSEELQCELRETVRLEGVRLPKETARIVES